MRSSRTPSVFSFVFSKRICLGIAALMLIVGACGNSARAQLKANQVQADATRAGKFQAFRSVLAQRVKANQISPDEYKQEDAVANTEVFRLMNKDYDNGVMSNLFYQVSNQVSKTILADPAAHKNELDAVEAEVKQLAVGVKNFRAQEAAEFAQRAEAAKNQRANTASNTRAQTGGVQLPPRPINPPSGDSFPTIDLLALLLIPVAGAGGYYFYNQQRQKPSSTSYADLKTAPPVATAPPIASAPPRPPSPPPAPASATGAPGGLKERLFAEQRAKYQARYNDVTDEMTAAAAELAQMGKVIEGIQNNLKLLSKAITQRAEAIVVLQNSNPVKLAISAAYFKPVFRLMKRAGGLLKLAIIGAVLYVAAQVVGLVLTDHTVVAVALYLAFFTVFFLIERHMQLKGPINTFHKSDEQLKSVSLAYVYDDLVAQGQGGAPAYRVIRVQTGGKTPPTEDFAVSSTSWGTTIRPDSFLLYLGNMAVYRLERSGTCALLFSNPINDVMKMYGPQVTAALAEQKSFAEGNLEPLASYANVALRRRKAAEELPELEKQLQNVGRVETLWRNTYVSDKVLEFLLRRIVLFNMRNASTPSGILLYGFPGNGKVHLAKKIADSISARFVEINAATFNSANEVKALWDKSRGKDPVVLFAEYAERIFPRLGSENAGSGTREATLAWLTEWARLEANQSHVWVVMSAQSEEELHPDLRRQIGGSKIEVVAPDAAGREMILLSACRENELGVAALPGWLVDSTGGASIRELRDIVKETKMLCVPYAPEDSHWRQAVQSVRGADATFKDETKTWEHLILPPDIKKQLQSACRILREGERYKAKGADIPNILLFGPPGTGKTEIARTLANEGGVKFIAVGTADLKAQYTGQSAHLVRDVFAKARAMAPAVLFIDEIETVAGKRDSSNTDDFTKDVVTEMLAQMSGAKANDRPVFVLAATNFQEQIDAAILSRFTMRIELSLPDEAARCEILKGEIGKRAVDPSLDIDEISAYLAKRTPRKSGRDLSMLVNRAMQRAVFASESPDDLRLTRQILLDEIAPQAKPVSDADLEKVWSQIVLKPEIKESILSKIRMFNAGDKAAKGGLLLYGPPGTGKTEIARKIADSTSAFFMSLKASDLKAGYVGQSGQAVKKIWEQAQSRDRCVMFIDECDSVFSRRGSVNTDSGTEEVVPEFLASWDGVGTSGQVWVIGATNQRQRLDDAIVSRFGAAVEIGLPEAPERIQILELEMKKLEREAQIPDFVGRATTGFAGRDLSQVAKDVCSLASEKRSAISPEMWKEAIARYAKASSESVDESARWDSLILSDDTLDKLKTVCESLRQIEVLQKQGITPPRGALLFGPPGTGKTQIARTMANESGLPFIAAGPADLKAGYLGQSGLKVHELFERARGKAPCILFIDEIESCTPARGTGQNDELNNEIVTQMLTELDGVKKNERHVFLLAATNHPETVDPAIRSRFVDQIEIPNPDADQRRRLFQIFLAKKHVDFDVDQMAAELAGKVGSISGRDVYSLVERASQVALRRALKAGTADHVILSREDLLAQLAPQAKEVSEADLRKIWSQIVLKPEIKESILSKIRMFNAGDKAAQSGMLLYGPPGTGKTEIARRIADSASCRFMSLTGSDLKAGYVGQSGQSVKKVWDQARAYGRCVIFIDECDAVFARRGSLNTDAATEEVVPEFLAAWDGVGSKGQIWVIGATNQRDRLDPAIVSRFGSAVEIGMPEAAQRLEILRLEMSKLGRDTEVPDFVGALTTGLAGRDLSKVAQDVCAKAAERNNAIAPETWREVLGSRAKAGGESVEEDASWESLVLSEDTLDKLKTVCESLRQIEVLQKQGIRPPRGALLFGPPGTGKTQIARTMANESGMPFIAAGPSDIKAGYIGQSGQKVHDLFERARSKAPCILFIDEIESGVPARGSSRADQFTDEIVTQMLTELDGVKKSERHVFLLAATNHMEAVDPAILSRFVDKIEIPNPDAAQRQRLFQILLAKKHGDFDVDQMAGELAGKVGAISGRDIYSLVERASQVALRRALKTGTADHVILSRQDLMAEVPGRAATTTGSGGL